jgi:hypothetical protein
MQKDGNKRRYCEEIPSERERNFLICFTDRHKEKQNVTTLLLIDFFQTEIWLIVINIWLQTEIFLWHETNLFEMTECLFTEIYPQL